METKQEPSRPLPIVAGHLALDLVDTIDDPHGAARHDHLGTYADLLRWAELVGVLGHAQVAALSRAAARRPREAGAVLRKAHRLRTVLTELFTAAATGGDPASHWPSLQPFATDSFTRAELVTGEHGYEFDWPPDEFAAMLWPVCAAAVQLLTGPELGRVKQCGGCPWLFLDQSKNGSRRWCAMGDCGTQAKMRRYVARRAQRRARS